MAKVALPLWVQLGCPWDSCPRDWRWPPDAASRRTRPASRDLRQYHAIEAVHARDGLARVLDTTETLFHGIDAIYSRSRNSGSARRVRIATDPVRR